MNTTATASSAKPKKLDEVRILAKVNAKVQSSVNWFDSKVAKENERVLRYYDQQEPKRQKEGNSSYVSSDVYDSVESMKAQLVETFGGSQKIVKFDPQNEKDVTIARVSTRYTEKVIFQQNDGFFILYDVIDTGLKARNAVAQVHWEDKTVYDEHRFQRMSLSDAQALASQDDVEIEAELNPHSAIDMEPTYKGKWRRCIDKGQVVIEVIPPEEFYVEKRVKKRVDGARGRRTLKTKADLITEGYDKKKVEKANASDKDDISLSPEAQARNEQTDEGVSLHGDVIQDELEQIMVFTTYVKMALDGKRSALYCVIHTDSVLFECDEVDEDPYVEFAPLRRPHRWWGDNYAAKSVPTQNARTVLTRGVLDHTAQTVSPRWQVLNGALQTPRELLDGRQGGIVNVKMRDGIAPLAYPNLNPFVFEVLTMLKDNKEEQTGISSLSQGLNKDAISTQNSQGLVGDMVALSQVRQKVVARNFAQFVMELYVKVYRCVVENDKRKRIEEVAGAFEEINPAEWASQRRVSLSLHLGYGEQDKTAMKLTNAYAAIAQDPILSRGFTYERRRKVAADILDESGIKNQSEWLEQQVTPPEPDPIELMKAQADKARADAALLTAQAGAAQKTADAELGMLKHQLEEVKAQLDGLVKSRDADRQDLDVANRIDVSQREITLAENAPPADTNTIVSPNG